MLKHIIRRGFGNWTVGYTDELLKLCAMVLLFVAVSPMVVGQNSFGQVVSDREFANLERSVRDIETASTLQAEATQRIIAKLDVIIEEESSQAKNEPGSFTGEQVVALLLGVLGGAGGLKAKQKITEVAGG